MICHHPSFYFHVRYLRGWDDWTSSVPRDGRADAGVLFGPVDAAAGALDGAERVIFVRTASDHGDLMRRPDFERRLMDAFDLRSEDKYLEDEAIDLKMRFVGPQPRWRARVQVYERKASGEW